MEARAIEQYSKTLALSEEDVERLLHDTSPAVRVDITQKISSAYSVSRLSARELAMAEQIFRLLLRDTEVRVRATLAQNVRDSAHIPRDLVVTMAKDVAEVALPILEFSEVLSDEDLLDLIHSTNDVTRYLAISRRQFVSETVSDGLIEKGTDEVVKALVRNGGVRLSDNGFGKIIETYKEDEAMMQSLTRLPYLPVATVEKLINVVSSGLAESLKRKYRLPTDQIEKEVEKTRDQETLGLVKLAHADEDIEQLITQLLDSGRLTPSIILSALCQGNFDFFELSLARLSGIPVGNARKLITDRGELGFRAIYNKSGLPDAMFPAVKLLLRVVRELDEEGERIGTPRFANRVVERILKQAEETPVDNVSYIIALVRRIAQ